MKIKLKPIEDQVVVLVGATSGIGLETAMYLVERQARVVIVGRSQDGLNQALEQVRAHAAASYMAQSHGSNGNDMFRHMTGEGGEYISSERNSPEYVMEDQVVALEGDITNFDQMRAVAEQTIQRFGRFDTWVNVAAVSEYALFEDTSPEEFRRIIDVNLVGHAYAAMAALPYLKQQASGALISVVSIAGRVPIPYQSAYNASKHGLLGMVETLRMEMEHSGIPVSITAILPASIDTPMFDKARTKLGVAPAPIPPVYDSRMVAKAITYAATHPVRELTVGDAAHMITFVRRVAPSLASSYMSATGFRQQRTSELKSPTDPDNMFEHIAGYNEVSGTNPPKRVMGVINPLTWLQTHPRARLAMYSGLMAGLGALIGWRAVKARQTRHAKLSYRIPKAYEQISKQAGKTARKAIKNAGDAVMSSPVVTRVPMLRRRSTMERTAGALAGAAATFWAAIMTFLPMRRRSLPQRVQRSVKRMGEKAWERQAKMMRKMDMPDKIKNAAGKIPRIERREKVA
jgi:NAD(P)-dependent dehydrogenase (short-subunit alcohol dehydrogenase family)